MNTRKTNKGEFRYYNVAYKFNGEPRTWSVTVDVASSKKAAIEWVKRYLGGTDHKAHPAYLI
ncbi:MAG: hypothetical protein MJZ26_02280 [Fibrobacter sp.]|nr:hypothetical protein [Fibrobacter sp.]